jgi:hypothetical protein
MDPVMMSAFADELAMIHGMEKDAFLGKALAGAAKGIGKMFKPKAPTGPTSMVGKQRAMLKKLPSAPKAAPPPTAAKGVPHGKGGWGVPQATPKPTMAQMFRSQTRSTAA